MQSKQVGKLVLVGAGPGDPDLITLKAIKQIKAADVILYDALVNDDLLEFAKPTCEKLFVGKRRGCTSFLQDQINELIVTRAKKGLRVIRLKGGDAFVFGRGAEEMEYAAQYGITTEIVPGITSAISIPALQNIPVTKRNHAESFWVITGTTKDHKLSKDVELAAQSTATVIILMGMSKLEEICTLFSKYNQEHTPVAIIQNGSLPNEKTIFGTIKTIYSLKEKHQIDNPAVIVIGSVVNHRHMIEQIVMDCKENQLDIAS